MKKVCPKDSGHEYFVTTAVITQDWLGDSSGDFIEVYEECTGVFARPDEDNIWICATCGAEAENASLKLVGS